MTSSLYKGNRMQGGYGGNSIGYNRYGRGYENRQGEEYEAFRQAIQNADEEFFERMQEEARQRGIREDQIRQGMQMIQRMRQGGNGGGGRQNFRMERGGKYYG